MRIKKRKILIFVLVVLLLFGLSYLRNTHPEWFPAESFEQLETWLPEEAESTVQKQTAAPQSSVPFSLADLEKYSGEPFALINDNQPYFSAEEITTVSYEEYGDLDDLGRCTACISCIGEDLMPTEERGSISSVKPTGWHSDKYDCVDGKYLYNRCHLIGYQLTAENANKNNLITGTRYMNVDGMLPFENMVADYIKETGNHVMYRVTPVFEEDNLVADGVLMEAYSVEDSGEGICYCVFCYNVQPGVEIDYSDGSSQLALEMAA